MSNSQSFNAFHAVGHPVGAAVGHPVGAAVVTWWRHVCFQLVLCEWGRHPWARGWSLAGWRHSGTWPASEAGCLSPSCTLPAFHSPLHCQLWRSRLGTHNAATQHHHCGWLSCIIVIKQRRPSLVNLAVQLVDQVAQLPPNNSSQRSHTSAKENMVWIRSAIWTLDLESGSGLLGDFLVQGYICDQLFMKIWSLSQRYKPNCGKMPYLTMLENPFKNSRHRHTCQSVYFKDNLHLSLFFQFHIASPAERWFKSILQNRCPAGY